MQIKSKNLDKYNFNFTPAVLELRDAPLANEAFVDL